MTMPGLCTYAARLLAGFYFYHPYIYGRISAERGLAEHDDC